MTFQRARGDAQKAERKAHILNLARELCIDFGVMGWSLNELGRRADITKSNLYRYFNSREAVLMFLQYQETERFVQEFSRKVQHLSCSVDELCQKIAETYDENPLLCELLSISASVLEKNTELESMREIKLASMQLSIVVAEAIASCTQEIDFNEASQIAFASGVIVMGLWPIACPKSPIRKLTHFEGLEGLDMNFKMQLEQMLKAQVKGLVQLS